MINQFWLRHQDLGKYKIPTLILEFIFVGRFVSNFLSQSYDWDIDHEMYFAQRLLHGELLYNREVFDKLPVNQLLLLIPAWFKSVKIWLIINTSIALFSSFNLHRLITQLLSKDWGMFSEKESRSVSFFCSSFYLFSLSSIWGSLMSINVFASSLTILSINSIYFYGKSGNFRKFIISAFYASIAISIRPYFAPSLIILPIWVCIRKFYSQAKEGEPIRYLKIKKETIFSFLKWIICLVFTFTLINITPYLITKNINIFYKGMIHLSNDVRPLVTPVSVLLTQASGFIKFGNIESFVYLSFLIPLIYLFAKIFKITFIIKPFKKILTIDIFFLCFLSPVFLELMFLTRHFWDHYHQFFIPYSSVSLGITIALVSSILRNNISIRLLSKSSLFSFMLIICLVSGARLEILKVFYELSQINISHSDTNRVSYIKNYLKERYSKGEPTDFLDVRGMYSHWKLNESRHGFPPAANVNNIYRGDWKNVKNGLDFVPYTKEALCKMFYEKSPSIIFVEQFSEAEKCLASVKQDFSIDKLGIVKKDKEFYSYTKK